MTCDCAPDTKGTRSCDQLATDTRTQYAIRIRANGPFTLVTADDAEYSQSDGRVVFVRSIERPEWRVTK